MSCQILCVNSPSTLNSFAVLDMTEGGKGAGDVLPTLFRKMTEHGITLPINVDLNMAMKKLIVRCSMPYGRDLKVITCLSACGFVQLSAHSA